MKIPSIILLSFAMLMTGCSSGGHIGDQLGVGAIAARNMGRDRMLIQVAPDAGAGIGSLIADEQDQAHAIDLSGRTVHSNYSHGELGPLTNTRWKARSMAPSRAGGDYLMMTVMFRPSGHVVTRTTLPDSTTRLVTERYRVVGDTLIINKDDYLINAQYRIVGEELTISAGAYTGVFDRMRSRDGL